MASVNLVASLLAALGAFTIAFGDRKASKWAKLVALLIAIAAMLSVVQSFLSGQQSAAFERDLRTKSDEIAALNREIAQTVTGGDSYCYLMVFPPSGTHNTCDLMAMTKGKYPVYDVSVKIDDVLRLVEIVSAQKEAGSLPYSSMSEEQAMLGQASRTFRLGNIGPDQAMQLGGIKAPEGNAASYNINIVARNGSVSQFIRFRRTNGKWHTAERLAVNGAFIKEEVDPNFPRESDGSIAW